MSEIQGLTICTPIVAKDFLRTVSTSNTPFFVITKVSLVFVQSGTTTSNYNVSFSYSLFDSVSAYLSLDPINYTYTGITSTTPYTITGDSDDLIQDSYIIVTDYFDTDGICYDIL